MINKNEHMCAERPVWRLESASLGVRSKANGEASEACAVSCSPRFRPYIPNSHSPSAQTFRWCDLPRRETGTYGNAESPPLRDDGHNQLLGVARRCLLSFPKLTVV
jgi:hypothetical protein